MFSIVSFYFKSLLSPFVRQLCVLIASCVVRTGDLLQLGGDPPPARPNDALHSKSPPLFARPLGQEDGTQSHKALRNVC